jgi:nucleotide-binding universal stress UspA family protein
MALTVLLCTDGSELAEHALVAGLEVLAPPDRLVLATVVEPIDPMLVVGTGMAAGVVSPPEAERSQQQREAHARALLEEARVSVGIPDAEPIVVAGSPGRAICELAQQLDASVVVLGTRGRGGLRRAVLGSVSDHVVRHAPCPVLVTGPAEAV